MGIIVLTHHRLDLHHLRLHSQPPRLLHIPVPEIRHVADGVARRHVPCGHSEHAAHVLAERLDHRNDPAPLRRSARTNGIRLQHAGHVPKSTIRIY